MKTDIDKMLLSTLPEPEELLLGDRTRFTRTPAGAYVGEPTPSQVGEIQGRFSDHSRIAFVRARRVGELPGFEIHYFLRET
jgi:hypothetical protein